MQCNFGHHGAAAHGPVLANKCAATRDTQLSAVKVAYDEFIRKAVGISFKPDDTDAADAAVSELTGYLNEYRRVAIPVFEKRDNSGQENLRSSILEEFLQLLLYPLTAGVRQHYSRALVLGKANSYVSLTFSPSRFAALFEAPLPTIHTKDQDLVLGCTVNLIARTASEGELLPSESAELQTVVPIVAVECKTYIERNMLDSSAGTAKRLKSAMPYCLFMVAAEYMKMEDAYPELTDIDEVFILTKMSNSERLRQRQQGGVSHDICADLVQELFRMVRRHLRRVWWSPSDAILRGRVIGRP